MIDLIFLGIMLFVVCLIILFLILKRYWDNIDLYERCLAELPSVLVSVIFSQNIQVDSAAWFVMNMNSGVIELCNSFDRDFMKIQSRLLELEKKRIIKLYLFFQTNYKFRRAKEKLDYFLIK